MPNDDHRHAVPKTADERISVDRFIGIATVGAYVMLDGRFPFVVGPTPQGDRLAVVRLGGHREAGEAPWDCAVREVREETGLIIRHVVPPCTYWYQHGQDTDTLISDNWSPEQFGATAPILIIRGSGTQASRLTMMYLASATGVAAPLAETRGLLFLTPVEVCRLVQAPLTLDQYLLAGGYALLREALPTHLPLEPFLQLRLLAALLRRYPDLFPKKYH